MLVFAEGFDDFNNAADILLTAATCSTSNSVVPGRGGVGKAISCYDPGTSWLFRPCDTCILGVAWFGVFGLYGSGYCTLVLRNAAAAQLFALDQSSETVVDFRDATNNVIGTSGVFKNFGSYVEVKLTPGNPGTVIVKIDGAIVFQSTTANLGVGPVTSLIHSHGGSAQIDDIYIADATGTVNNDFFGDTRVVSAAPTGDGTHTDLSPSTAGAHYPLVAEFPIDRDTNYVAAGAAGQIDTYTFPPLDTTAQLRAVLVTAYLKTASGGVDRQSAVARVAGTDYLSPDALVSAVYAGTQAIFEKNPATTAPWTASEVNAAEFGIKRTA